jgi:hypothetical protein
MNDDKNFFRIKRNFTKVNPSDADYWVEYTKLFFAKNVKGFSFAKITNIPRITETGDVYIKFIITNYVILSYETMQMIHYFYPNGTKFLIKNMTLERDNKLAANPIDVVTEFTLMIPNSGITSRFNIQRIYIKIIKNILVFLLLAIVIFFYHNLGTFSY